MTASSGDNDLVADTVRGETVRADSGDRAGGLFAKALAVHRGGSVADSA